MVVMKKIISEYFSKRYSCLKIFSMILSIEHQALLTNLFHNAENFLNLKSLYVTLKIRILVISED